MRHYTDTSDIYQGTELSFFLIEGEKDKAANRYIRGHLKSIRKHLEQRGVRYAAFNIISRSTFGTRSAKNMILRQCPTISKEELASRVKNFKNERKKLCRSRLIYISDVVPTKNGSYCADILCEDDFERDGDYMTTLYRFLDSVVGCDIARDNAALPGGNKYRLPDDEDEKEENEFNWDNSEYFGYDQLAGNIEPEPCFNVSPIHFDRKFNIVLPLYPQIEIKLDPLPKALYILLLNHPEGIFLKDIQKYEAELRNIYTAVSGRKNQSAIDRMMKSLINPVENPLHKNLSIIRRSFLNKLRFDIARHYIPAHNRSKAHSIPINGRLVDMPEIAM